MPQTELISGEVRRYIPRFNYVCDEGQGNIHYLLLRTDILQKKSLVLLNSAVLILSVAVQWWMHRDRSPRDLYKFCVQNEPNRKIFDLFEVNRRPLEILNYTCIISLQILLSATCFSTTGRNLWCLVPGFIFLFKRWCVWLLLALVCRWPSLSFLKHLR